MALAVLICLVLATFSAALAAWWLRRADRPASLVALALFFYFLAALIQAVQAYPH